MLSCQTMVINRWTIFAVGAVGFLISNFYRTSQAIIATELAVDLNLSLSDLGFLGAAFFYVFALVQIPLGLILDRLGPKKTMIALNLAAAVGAVTFAAAHTFAAAMVGRMLLGLGMSANLMGPLTLFRRWFPVRLFAAVTGTFMALGGAGSMLASSPMAVMVKAIGWRGGYYVLTAINVLVIIALALWVKDNPAESGSDQVDSTRSEPDRTSALDQVKILLSSRDYWVISMANMFRYGCFAAIQALWAGPYLINVVGLDPIMAGQLLLLLNLGALFGSPMGGIVADKVLNSRRLAIISGLIALSGSFVALVYYPGHWPLVGLGAVLLFMGFSSSFTNIAFAHITQVMPPHMSGTALTGVNFFGMLGAGASIHFLGGLLEFTGAGPEGYHRAFLICGAVVFIWGLLYFLSREGRADG